jgi:mono/diheme cytochrome c family protein
MTHRHFCAVRTNRAEVRLAFSLAALIVFAGCSGKPSPTLSRAPVGRSPAEPSRPDPAAGLSAAQGLSGDERERFYHLDMGGEIIPLDWLRALESSRTGKPFLEDIERFGLLPDPANRDGLPIGLTAAESRDSRLIGKMVGLNCAACHTAELTFRGRRLRIDGGAGMFDATAFATDLTESIASTVGSAKRLLAFVGRLHKLRGGEPTAAVATSSRSDLLGELAAVESLATVGAAEKALVEHLTLLIEKELERSPTQPARLSLRQRLDQAVHDAKSLVGEVEHGELGDILKKEAGKVLSKIEDREAAVRDAIEHAVVQVRLLKARVELLKKMKSLQSLATTEAGPGRADDFATARNTLFDEQFAIAATAPCSIPPLWNTTAMTWTDWDGNTTSAMGRSMATALAGGASFDPETYISTVSPRNLYEFEKLVAKIQPPVWPGDTFGPIDKDKAARGAALFEQHCAKCHVTESGPPPDLLYNLEQLGTDPARAENFATNLGERPFADALRDAVGKYLDRAYKEFGISEQEAKQMEAGHPNQWRPTRKYASRPLVAVWATAPYLHNGSVPTLDDLLRPAAGRPKSFAVGHGEFDPVKVGLAAAEAGAGFVFDTSKPGNSNAGHEFGTDLPDDDRRAIIEYLKAP